jgi:hypothetical protein
VDPTIIDAIIWAELVPPPILIHSRFIKIVAVDFSGLPCFQIPNIFPIGRLGRVLGLSAIEKTTIFQVGWIGDRS